MISTWTLIVVIASGMASDGTIKFETHFQGGYPSKAACEEAWKEFRASLPSDLPNSPTHGCVEEYGASPPATPEKET